LPTNKQYKKIIILFITEDDYKGQVKITHFCETTDYARQWPWVPLLKTTPTARTSFFKDICHEEVTTQLYEPME
jgi:hypothetical protein